MRVIIWVALFNFMLVGVNVGFAQATDRNIYPESHPGSQCSDGGVGWAKECPGNTPIGISGPGEWIIGNTWRAYGGVGPYFFNVEDGGAYVFEDDILRATKGVVNQCGKIQIKATDRCGTEIEEESILTVSVPTPEGLPVPIPTISGPEIANVGSKYSASGGLGYYSFGATCGEMDKQMGEFLNIDGCCETGRVDVIDGCFMMDSMNVQFWPGDKLTISGPENANTGTQYAATGGRTPYTFSVDRGAIDSQTGKITSVPTCTPGADRWATVTVKDACGQETSMEIRYPGGKWVKDTTRGTCTSFCNDYGMPAFKDFYSGGRKYTAWVYWGQAAKNGTCTSGEVVSGTSGGFTGSDGNKYLSLPALSAPFPEVRGCNNSPCGGYQGWGACGVCGSCATYPNPRLCYYAKCVQEYIWECP